MTRTGLTQEQNGDFRAAFKTYRDALKDVGHGQDASEMAIWQNRALICVDQMGNWDTLQNSTIEILYANDFTDQTVFFPEEKMDFKF